MAVVQKPTTRLQFFKICLVNAEANSWKVFGLARGYDHAAKAFAYVLGPLCGIAATENKGRLMVMSAFLFMCLPTTVWLLTFLIKVIDAPYAAHRKLEELSQSEVNGLALKLRAVEDIKASTAQKETNKSVQLFLMASLLTALQDRIDTISKESELKFTNSFQNNCDVISDSIIENIKKYLVENMDMVDWLLVSSTTGLVRRPIYNDGIFGFEDRLIKERQLERLNFMAAQLKKLIDDYKQKPL